MERAFLRGQTNSHGRLFKSSLQSQAVLFMLVAALLVLWVVNLVRHDVVFIVDGERQEMSTYSFTVAQFLDEVGIVVKPADYLSIDLDQKIQRGMVIEVESAFPVTVQVDGEEHVQFVAKKTAAEVLSALNVELGSLDRVEPAMTHILEPGEQINVVRVQRHVFKEKTELPFREVYRSNPDLDRGETRVLSEGEPGVRVDTVEIIREDGIEVSVKVLQSEMMQPRQDRIVETGGNTVISRGGRSVSFDRVLSMAATAYCAGTAESGCPIDSHGHSVCTGSQSDGVTASGRQAVAGSGSEDNPHLVAVDRRIIPLGSQLYIDGYGFAVAADTGGAIVGKKIDLLFKTHEEARHFGRRNLRVYLLP